MRESVGGVCWFAKEAIKNDNTADTSSVTLSVSFNINSIDKHFSFDLTYHIASTLQCDLIETKEMRVTLSLKLVPRHLLSLLT